MENQEVLLPRTGTRCERTALAVAAILALLLPASAAAQPPSETVDQEQPIVDVGENTIAIGGSSEQKLAQTFTVGKAGRLSGVAFPVGCADGTLRVEIQGVAASGEPDGSTLVSRGFRADSFPNVVPATFQRVPLPRRLRVAVGDQLAVVLSNDSGTCAIASGPDGDSYSSGRAYFDSRPNAPGWIPFSPLSAEDDTAFQTLVFGR